MKFSLFIIGELLAIVSNAAVVPTDQDVSLLSPTTINLQKRGVLDNVPIIILEEQPKAPSTEAVFSETEVEIDPSSTPPRLNVKSRGFTSEMSLEEFASQAYNMVSNDAELVSESVLIKSPSFKTGTEKSGGTLTGIPGPMTDKSLYSNIPASDCEQPPFFIGMPDESAESSTDSV
ncbi:hypothetical protein BASA61_000581 [Batrachochytrium salamandrivorans]|nr:hypothetical protein BASA62_002399 [Batrachochytrium salamandrivorans]KAH6602955.1 hypothetical protein BASA61_000581 [Batrachochytrium salamandrivorans]KAH9265906.1 hypothetical protein BASA84_001366 [Batrachochytrium salamandrivorans]